MAQGKKKSQERMVFEINAMGFHAFFREGERLAVSAEEGDDAADYYGEFRGGYQWINPELEQYAADNRFYWEWENPGCICAYEY